MAHHRIKPHQQAILDAFDAGERSLKRLAEASGYGVGGVRSLLLRFGRKPDDASAARKAAWADPAVRAKISAARKAALADPAVRAKISAARKAAWADPAVRAKMSAASKAALADPAVRAKMSAARKAAWADPAVRAKMSAARKARKDPWLAGLSEDEIRW